MSVHSYASPVQQDRAGNPACDRAFHSSGDRGWERGEHDLSTFAANLQDSVAVFLTEVGDVGPASFEESATQRRPSMATNAKSFRLAESRDTASIASN